MIEKNILTMAIIAIALLSACNQIEAEKELVKKISTRAGELTLRYENGRTTLSGTLQRSTPCVEWIVEIATTEDLPISNVNMEIFNKNKGVICIQVVGDPQSIQELVASVSENTKYTIKFEDEIIFAGKLN